MFDKSTGETIIYKDQSPTSFIALYPIFLMDVCVISYMLGGLFRVARFHPETRTDQVEGN